jgi:two-component system, NarL family, sensor histidine kinase UhpB
MKRINLIIIEDSADDTMLILNELKKGGYDPFHVRIETEQALDETIKEDKWDLIISDHALPCFSVPQALYTVNKSGKELPFIIVSSAICEDIAVAAMKAGADDYIMKSDLGRLTPVVERILNDTELRAERKKVKEDLRESEARFRRLAENARDLIYRITLVPERRFEYVSPSSTNLLGYTPEDHYANPNLGFEMVHPEDHALLQAVANGEMEISKPLTMRWIRKDNTIIWVEQRNVPIYDVNGRLVAIEGIARDISEQVLKEQQLKTSHAKIEALSNRILGAMEEERTRLARELHDEVGQALTAVKLDLQLLQDELAAFKPQCNKLRQSIELVDHTLNLVRRQSVSLRPPTLDSIGLIPAIREMTGGFMKRTGVDTNVTVKDFPAKLPMAIETALYRCVQESLTNVARHSRAKAVSVELSCCGGLLSVSVADDGIGFIPNQLTVSTEHIGLTGMHERVRLLGGEMNIDSAPGIGACVKIEVPLQQPVMVSEGGCHESYSG